MVAKSFFPVCLFLAALISVPLSASSFAPGVGAEGSAFAITAASVSPAPTATVAPLPTLTPLPAPLNLSANAGSSGAPRVAVDVRGGVHVVWEDNSYGNYEVLYRRRSLNEGWSAVGNLSQSSGISGATAIAADLQGSVHVVWQDYSPGNYDILYRRWSSSEGWSMVENVSRTSSTSSSPAVAAGPGGIHVVWREYASGGSSVFYRRWSGGAWSAAENLTPGSATSGSPAVAGDSAGNVHVVWVDENPGNYEVYYRRWDGVSWSPAENLSRNAGRSTSPAIAAGPDGAVHVVWQDASPGTGEILYRRWSGGVWSSAENISDDAGLSGSPALAVDTGGSVHVVWMDDTPGNYEILYRRWSQLASGWLAAENLSKNSGFSLAPAVAAGSGGIGHVVWEDGSPGNFDIFYSGPAVAPISPPTRTPAPTPSPMPSPVPTATPAPSPSQIQLYEGWNLISVPAPLQNPAVGAVFAQAPSVTRVLAWTGDAWTSAIRGAAGWSGTLAEIAEGRGYFVYAAGPTLLSLAFRPPDASPRRPTYPLPVGWSLVGYVTPALTAATPVSDYLTAIAGKWTSLFRLDPVRGWELAKPGGIGFANMERGKGYWISMREPGALAP